MTIALQYCNITVNDVDESIAFYRDALGLQVRNDVPSGGFRWVTLGSDAQPGLEIVLSVPHAGRSALTRVVGGWRKGRESGWDRVTGRRAMRARYRAGARRCSG